MKRNYCFFRENEDCYDVVEDENGKSFVVPAQPGSSYWAVIRVGYENHDQPIRKEDFIDQIASLMEDRDPARWQRFVSKKRTKIFKNKQVIEKDALSWRDRILANIKMMCRHSGNHPYGQRLIERGHILRWEPNAFDGEGGYCLRTTTNVPLVVRKRRAKIAKEEAKPAGLNIDM
jgi:hypothetical protein